MGRAILLSSLVLGLTALLLPRGDNSDVDAGTAVRLDIDELVNEADQVFEGYVRESKAVRTAEGRIETEYTIEVDRVFFGDVPGNYSVRIPGGILEDGYGLILPGLPEVLAGEEVILFLSEAGGSGVRMPVGLSQGKFRVETDLSGQRHLTRRHGSLTTIDPQTGQTFDAGGSQVFDYAGTVAEIAAAASLKESR
ncbi:MAG: hypothetical protein ACI8X5_002280 [Planctomycetota bacterium]|jgi:hypothetical protein